MERKLIDYYPEALKEFVEFQVLTDSEQREIEQLWNAGESVLADQFVSTATEAGLSRWEGILNIVPKGTSTMEERRFLILTRLQEALPYTMRMLKRQLEALCGNQGYLILLKNNEYTLIIRVSLTVKSAFSDVRSLLERVVPANMVVDISLLYNQHITVGRFRHNQLKSFSHNKIRNEVI